MNELARFRRMWEHNTKDIDDLLRPLEMDPKLKMLGWALMNGD